MIRSTQVWAGHVIAFALLSGAAMAQGPAGRPTVSVSRSGRPLANPRGVVTAVTSDSITLESRGGGLDLQTVFPFDTDLVVACLKPVKLADIKEPAWATVFRASNPD